MVGKSHTVFLADTTINERPAAEELADIAEQTAPVARRMGHEPRVAFLSYSTFGNPDGRWLDNIRDAVAGARRAKDPGFEYQATWRPTSRSIPNNTRITRSRGCRPANVLVMPSLQSANISAKLLRELGGDAIIGPMLVGMEKSVQIVPMTAPRPEVVTLAVLRPGGLRGSSRRPGGGRDRHVGACGCPTPSEPGLAGATFQASMLDPKAAFTSPPSTAMESPQT